MEKWIGKIAVVTGASSGIGEGIVKALASAGITVIGLARRSEKIEEIAKEVEKAPGKVHAYKCDVSDVVSVKKAFKWIEDTFGTIHILVNCAGVFYPIMLLGNDDVTEKVNSLINTNLTGLIQCTQEAYRLMKKSDDYGMIINICSFSGHTIPFVNISANAYGPSKAAVKSLSEVLRQELVILNNKKIRISNLSPGIVRTEMTAHGDDDPLASLFSTNIEPKDVAQAIKFLLETPYTVNITEMMVRAVGERF